MSSLYTQFQSEIVTLFSAAIVIIAYLGWFQYWHTGFGVELVYKISDRSVYIASRLLNYPAHHHCIPNEALVVSIDGTPMQFRSGEDFLDWFKAYRPKKSIASKWVVRISENKEIRATMMPILVTSKIPVYWSPNHTRENEKIVNWRVQKSLCYCSKTGQYSISKRLSREALSDTFFET